MKKFYISGKTGLYACGAFIGNLSSENVFVIQDDCTVINNNFKTVIFPLVKVLWAAMCVKDALKFLGGYHIQLSTDHCVEIRSSKLFTEERYLKNIVKFLEQNNEQSSNTRRNLWILSRSRHAYWCLPCDIFNVYGGVILSQLALLQVAFSVTVLLFDFPCAVLADRYWRKYSVTAGVFMTGLFYPLSLQAPNMMALIIAQIIYAAGICLIASAIDGWIYHSLDNKQDRFSHYAHLSHQINSFGSIISGIVGIATIYYSGQYFIGYIISCLMMGIIFLIFLVVPEEKKSESEGIKTKTIVQNAKETLWIFQNTMGGAWFILLMCLFSAGIQVIYHFWQPIILSDSKLITSIAHRCWC
ncbi:hypothetical protein ABID23_000845 [Bartonella silvatica]|uniref:Uncharacterized protein n=1 Tax=Bartonella silvatica TaxID=357760 RepID=A0ABV2HGU7_9HYPH